MKYVSTDTLKNDKTRTKCPQTALEIERAFLRFSMHSCIFKFEAKKIRIGQDKICKLCTYKIYISFICNTTYQLKTYDLRNIFPIRQSVQIFISKKFALWFSVQIFISKKFAVEIFISQCYGQTYGRTNDRHTGSLKQLRLLHFL